MRNSVTEQSYIFKQSYSQSQRIENPFLGVVVNEIRLLTEFGEVTIRKPLMFPGLRDGLISITIEYEAVNPQEEIGTLVDGIIKKPVPGTADEVAARVKEALYLANLIRFGEKK